ncbi:hypothetical protein [Saccharopolyspora sp. CA-218241]|uniref:hypothetical protein n=1 Tax=Saccharopolyspora sp. CA-218241 TaxID=3240027 RepID=UPI003D9992CE
MVVYVAPAQGLVRVLRGAVLAITSSSLSVAAHAAAGGALPGPGSTAVIISLIAGAGAALAGRKRGSWSILGALAVSQGALHAFLQLMGTHQHGSGVAPMPFSPWEMTAGHAAVAVGTALVMAHAERALFVAASLLGRLLPRRPSPLPVVADVCAIMIPAPVVRVLAELIGQRIHGLRGPPGTPVSDHDSVPSDT